MSTIILLISVLALAATWIGILQARRFGDTYFAISMILLFASTLSGLALGILLYFYSDHIGEDVAIPWVENLGFAFGIFAVAFFFAAVFTLAAKVVFAITRHVNHNTTDA